VTRTDAQQQQGLNSLAPLAAITGHLIRRSQQVHNVLWSKYLPGELTGPQYAVLSVLASFPRSDQQTVGRLASLDKSSVADVVARLVRQAWIVRTRDTADARRYVLALTPAAAIALSSITPAAAAVQDALLKPLDDARGDTFVRELAAVARLDAKDLRNAHAEGYPVLDLSAPGHLIRRAQQVHTAIWAEVVGSDLTGPQYAVLHVVSRSPGINQRQLGELAALDKSSTADIVARLVSRGQMIRGRDPHDGRGRVLLVPDEELLRLQKMHPLVAEVQSRLLEPLGPAARKAFVHDLARVAFCGEPPPAASGPQ
jgi:DNA-binding MarR family transcriptional regulator